MVVGSCDLESIVGVEQRNELPCENRIKASMTCGYKAPNSSEEIRLEILGHWDLSESRLKMIPDIELLDPFNFFAFSFFVAFGLIVKALKMHKAGDLDLRFCTRPCSSAIFKSSSSDMVRTYFDSQFCINS